MVNCIRSGYHSVRSAYRYVRSLRNQVCNLYDTPIIILVYHRVTDLPSDPEMLAVSPENFRLHMEFLKRSYRLLRFEEEWSGLREPAVVVTFDDGYADNVLEALPVLEELGLPATFFVSTGNIGTGREFWWDRLGGILLRPGKFPAHFRPHDTSFGRKWDTGSFEQRRALYFALSLRMLRLGAEHQQRWLDQLVDWAGQEEDGKGTNRSMSFEELQQLASSSWATIGAHTVSHSALSILSEKQQREEIFSSKQKLERITGKKINTFSYPFGRKIDYNRTSVRLCREAGFLRAASNFPGQVHRWTDRFQLPRHLVRNWDQATFISELEGFWTR